MRVNLENLKHSHQFALLAIDMLMLLLLVVNLVWLSLDTLYGIALINEWLALHFSGAHKSYAPIHANFLLIDLIFVSIFLTEFIFRWAVSVWQKEYFRWYFFPFAHWYDLIGCIPVGPYRFLRVLRVLSILYRLHKYRIVDLSQSAIYRFLSFYYQAFVEEVSDRVVINVLRGTQSEIDAGSPLFKDVVDHILVPRKQLLVNWLSEHLEKKTGQALHQYEPEIKVYIQEKVSQAVTQNTEFERLKSAPIVGDIVADTLSSTISDIVFQTIISVLQDLSTKDNKVLVNDVLNTLLDPVESNEITNQDVREVINEVINRVIEQVSIQRWKESAS